MNEIEDLQDAIQALEKQRGLLGDAIVDTAIAPMRSRLAQLREHHQQKRSQLKYATILFTDITDSTQISQELDPEDMMSVMDGAMHQFGEIITKYGGRVLKYMGDGLMAIFGVPITREGDAERSVQAGLEIIEEAKAYGQLIRLRWGLKGFNVRIGINTGLIVYGGGIELENTAIGMAINLASRMESAAPEGGLLITRDTYQHVHGIFEVEEQPLLKVKGRDDPIQSYLVKGQKIRDYLTDRQVLAGVEAPIIGREEEFALLQESYNTFLKQAGLTMLWITGDPGVGKSHLLRKFVRWMAQHEEPPILFMGRAFHLRADTPYGLLRLQLNYRFNITESDLPEVVVQRLSADLSEYLGADSEMKTHFIAMLLGYDLADSPYLKGVRSDPAQIRERALAYLSEYLCSASEEKPLAMVLEDIQWADDSSLEALAVIARECADARLFLIVTSRPEIQERREILSRESGDRELPVIELKLNALSEEACRNLVRAILPGVEDLPDSLVDLIASSAEGNPYYVEEIINILIDDRVLVRKDDGSTWQIERERLNSLRMPPTLLAVQQARLDSLAPLQKQMIQQAATVGRIFWSGVIQSLQEDESRVGRALEELTARGLIIPHESSPFKDSVEYAFRNALMRDAAYDILLKRDRQGYHARIAEWLELETSKNNSSGAYAAVMAEHYFQAANADKAADWYLIAARYALDRNTIKEARQFFSRVLDLLVPDDLERRWSALLGHEESLGILGEVEARRTETEKLLTLAWELKDDNRLAEAYYRRGLAAYYRGQYGIGQRSYKKALAAARRAKDPRLEALTSALLAVSLNKMGRAQEAKTMSHRALTVVKRLDDDEVLARVYTNAAVLYTDSGDYARGIELLNKAISINNRTGNKRGEAIGLSNLGYTYIQLGMPELATNVLQQSIQICRSVGWRQTQAYSELNLGLAHAGEGRLNAALDALVSTQTPLAELRDSFGQSTLLTYLGIVYEQQHKMAEAIESYGQAFRSMTEIGIQARAMDALVGVARCLLNTGDVAQAREKAELISAHLDKHGSQGMEFPIRAYLVCADTYMASGDSRNATQSIELGYNELMRLAKQISDPSWRDSFLENVEEHSQIITRWGQFAETRL